MAMTRVARWENFIEELKRRPPEDHIVQLTFSIQYSEQRIPYIALNASCLQGDLLLQVIEHLAFAHTGRDHIHSVAMQSRFDDHRKDLEALGLIVKPGRYRHINHIGEGEYAG